MKLVIKINEARFKDIQRIAEVQLEMSHFPTAEQIIAKGVPIEQELSALDKIRAEIKQAADKQFQIAMGVADFNKRYAHIQMENAYRHSLNIIDKYKVEPTGAESEV